MQIEGSNLPLHLDINCCARSVTWGTFTFTRFITKRIGDYFDSNDTRGIIFQHPVSILGTIFLIT